MPLLHAAINVSDVEESIAFYRDVFGMEPVEEADGEIRQVWVGRDGESDFQLREVDGEGPIGPAGVDHVAIDVEDVDGVAGRVDPESVTREPEDIDSMGIRIAFITDPDGYEIELIEPLE